MEDTSTPFYKTLISSTVQIGLRYQAIFQLKHLNTSQSIIKLVQAYPYCKQSILLRHEILYALGQLDSQHLPNIREFLIKIVNDQEENNLCRHESAQALANYFLPELSELYSLHLKSKCNQLRWTCEIAIEKVKHEQLKNVYGQAYSGTKQPAAPFSEQDFSIYLTKNNLQEIYAKQGFLGILLLEISLFDKYRIMYLMRNRNNKACRQVLCKLLSLQYYKSQTSLLKHEICFILGQIGCQDYENLVRECIENEKEEDIVRHQALAAVASQSKDIKYLDKFTNYPNLLIRQSAQVAQFSIKYWNN